MPQSKTVKKKLFHAVWISEVTVAAITKTVVPGANYSRMSIRSWQYADHHLSARSAGSKRGIFIDICC
jgi:hypothetical protein